MADALYVLLPTAGPPRGLARTLASLAACERPAIYQETVVVENGPPHGAEAIVEACDPALNARYVHVARANKSHALNEAIKTIGDGLVFFTDDDVRLDPGVLAAYARAAEGRTGGAFFGGPTRVDRERPPDPWLVPFLPPSALGWADGPGGMADAYHKQFMGFNWAAFVGDVRAAGGFDPNVGPGAPTASTGQETDMQLRLEQRGAAQVFVPDAEVWHTVPAAHYTVRWVARRQFRVGVHRGLQMRPVDAWLGYPKRSLYLLALRVGSLLKRALLGDREGMLRAYLNAHFERGVIHGYRLRTREDIRVAQHRQTAAAVGQAKAAIEEEAR